MISEVAPTPLDFESCWSDDDLVRFAGAAEPEVRVWALERVALFAPDRLAPLAAAALRDESAIVQSNALRLIEMHKLGDVPDVASALDRYHGRRKLDPRLRALARHVRTSRAPETLPVPETNDVLERLDAASPTMDEAARSMLVADLAKHPNILASIARKSLPERTVRSSLVWRALQRHRSRWAVNVVLDALIAALDAGLFGEPWATLALFGDPAALGAVLREWRPGEPRIARVALFLATLAGERHRLPTALAEEADEARRRLAAALDGTAGMDDADGRGVPLQCNPCGRTYWYEFGEAYVHPDPDACRRDGWDGVAFTRIIVCKRCSASDDYALTAMAAARLSRAIESKSKNVFLGVANTVDGATVRRTSLLLGELRERAQTERTSEAWLRFGNAAERCGHIEAAERAWRSALAIDPGHTEANYCLAVQLWSDGRRDEAWACALQVIPHLPDVATDGGARAAVVKRLFDMLRVRLSDDDSPGTLRVGWTDRESANVGAIDLRRFARWDALVAFLSRAELSRVGLTHEKPMRAEGDAALVRAIAGDAKGVGRNDACPCGSGAKYKKCCGS